MRHPRPKFKVSFYLYFCCFWINVTQLNFENIKRKIQRISDSCFQLKLLFNVHARAPSVPLLNFPLTCWRQFALSIDPSPSILGTNLQWVTIMIFVCFLCILQILDKSNSHRAINRVRETLRRCSIGLQDNPGLSQEALLIFIHGLTSETLPLLKKSNKYVLL